MLSPARARLQQVEVLAQAERFLESAVLFALVESGLLEHLADGPRTLDELAAPDPEALDSVEALVDAAVALSLLTRDEAGYHADPALIACLTDGGGPADLRPWLRFLRGVGAGLLQLGGELARGRHPDAFEGCVTEAGVGAAVMGRAMDSYARSRGAELAERLQLSGTEHLVDLGAGEGHYGVALAERHPNLSVTLVDSGETAAAARSRVAAAGLADRVKVLEADATHWRPEVPADAVLLSNMLHMLGPEAAAALVLHAHELLRPGGLLVIQAQFLDEERASPRWPALANLILVASTPRGRNHTVSEATAWARAAGFETVDAQRLSVGNVNGLLLARKREIAPAVWG